MSIDRWMDIEDVVHIYNGMLLSYKKKKTKWNNAIFSDVDGPRDCQTEWCIPQTESDKYMISLICGILKNGTNELIYKKEIESQM